MQLKHFNLEIGLFLKEIKSCIADDNEINDETVKLIAETMSSMDKLLCRAKFHESLPDNENDFFFDLNNEHFQFRRHIVCCLCHVSKKLIFFLESVTCGSFFWFNSIFHPMLILTLEAIAFKLRIYTALNLK